MYFQSALYNAKFALLQVGKFVVGQAEGTDEQIGEDQVEAGLRFPTIFRGEGRRGHAYHVFSEPRYYS